MRGQLIWAEHMKSLLVVALGGALGSVARYKVSEWVLYHSASALFPAGTFLVNILGCLLIGVLAGMSMRYDSISPEARLFLFTGILGGFTTFSAFGLETFYLLRKGELLIAGANVILSVIVGLLVLWAGFNLVMLKGH